VPEVVDLLVLASSKKGGGRCVAGWDLVNGRWLRPVSARADGTLELEQCQIEGNWPRLFDIVRLEIDSHRPTPYQPENWVIAGRAWERIDVADPVQILDDLAGLVDHTNWLVTSGDRRVDAAGLRASPATSSLVLLRPENAQWRLERFRGDRQYKTTFRLDGRDE